MTKALTKLMVVIGAMALVILALNVFKIPISFQVGNMPLGYAPATVINEAGQGGGNTAAPVINNSASSIIATPAQSSPGAAPGNPEPQGGWVLSYCEYRVGFRADMPSGKSVSTGNVTGPAMLIPLNGNVASWVGTALVFEGETRAVT